MTLQSTYSLQLIRFVSAASAIALPIGLVASADGPPKRIYQNQLTLLENPPPLLADYPEYVQPVIERQRFEAPVLVDEEGADLAVRAWRYSYNARGIIEMPNRLRADHTAVIVVHPWGIDDGQGWRTPEPNGVAFFCTPAKNHFAAGHTREVIEPFLKRDITMHKDDVVAYDDDGYPPLRDFLKHQGVRHILLTGYATDMCFCSTTAGYQNLSKDFNVFLMGDATLPTFPANATPKYATNAHISFASINQLVTQVSWVRSEGAAAQTAAK